MKPRLIMVALVVLSWATPAAAQSFVTSQRAAAAANAVTTSPLSATTTDLIVAWCFADNITTPCTVSDSGAHTWTRKSLASDGSTNQSYFFYTYGSNITAGTPTVTASTVPTTVILNLEVIQIAGTDTSSDPYDVESVNHGTGTTFTSGSFTTTTANQIILAGAFHVGALVCDTVGAIGGTTATLASCTVEYRIVSAIQTGITAAMSTTDASSAWTINVVTFRAAGGGPAPTTPCMRALLRVGCDEFAAQPGERVNRRAVPWRVGQAEDAQQEDRAAEHQSDRLHRVAKYSPTVSRLARKVR